MTALNNLIAVKVDGPKLHV